MGLGSHYGEETADKLHMKHTHTILICTVFDCNF